MSVYKNLQFPILDNRPYFFSNFVTTIDGRTLIKDNLSYTPIGSKTDFATFLDLRKYADALIHGKHTAALHRTIETIAQKKFLQKRKNQDKPEILPYFILTNHPDSSLLPALIQNSMQKPYLVTHKKAKIIKDIVELVTIVRVGEDAVDLSLFSQYLFSQGYKHILIEGGPTLMGSFLHKDFIDEMFVTIAPKIFNGRRNEYLTMTEGPLINSDTIKKWQIISTKVRDNEVFLRYQRN